MPWYDENTYVIKTKEPERMREHFEAMGLEFVQEQHGDGPTHYACERNGKVLEIYPR